MSNIRTDWTVLSMLKWATEYFEKKGVRNPRLSIEWILAHVLDKKRLDLYLIFDRPLRKKELDSIRSLVKRRANHEPLQYLTEETDFFGYPFHVAPGVLIPRPETEQLVELLLDELAPKKDFRILDVGSGSGCIPIALKKEREHWDVNGIDISEEALSIAKKNAVLNNCDVSFQKEDFFSPSDELLAQSFDAIISNPPYIEYSEIGTIDEEVKSFEPEVALFTSSIQQVYSALENLASRTLRTDGILALELNERLASDILEIFCSSRWETKLLRDYSEKDRFILAKKFV